MTPFYKVYQACLAIITDDDWGDWTIEETEEDLNALLLSAIPYFKFPRISLELEEEGFVNELDNEEIQILANYMAFKWAGRCIYTWENIKPTYAEQDFSQGNLLDKLQDLLETSKKEALFLENIYYRAIKGKPFDYSRLVGYSE